MTHAGASPGLAPTPLEAAVVKREDFKTAARPGPAGRALDRVIREVSPAWARRRQQTRAYLALGDGYEVTKAGRTRRTRSYAGGPADRHLDPNTLFRLREICRDADRQSPLMHGIIERWIDNIAGPTFAIQPLTEDEGWNKDAREYVEMRMGRSADLARRFTFRRLVRPWLRSIATDGDCLVAFTEGGLATYEADQLATPWGQAAAGTGAETIVNGVRVDPATGRALGYYVAPREYRGFVSADWARTARYIPASEALFPANLHRVSQTRGVPILASALGVFDHLDGYLDNEQVAAEVASMLVYFIKRANPQFFTDPDTGNLASWVQNDSSADGTERQLEKVEPGQLIAGCLGDELELLNPARPGQTFEPYVVTTLRLIGAGIGMPLELVLLDFSRTTYSSARASLLQAYRTFMCWQGFAVSEMIGPCYERWIGQAIVEGDLTLRDDAFRAKFLMPRWAWVDPLKEILAAEKGVAMGIDTLTDFIEREQQTLAEYVRVRKAELAAFQAAGVPTTTAPLNLGAAAPTPGPAAPEPAPPDSDEDDRREREARRRA